MDHNKETPHPNHPSALSSSSNPIFNQNTTLLKNWFQQEITTSTDDCDHTDTDSSSPSSKLARILLLDGGVSTHLESILQQNQQQHQSTKKEEKEKQQQSSVFPHRELWSSSLLLSSGKDAIKTCHEHFYNAGADIVSTVTYQCHYSVCQQPKEGGGGGLYLSEDTVDKMLCDGVQLAREAAANVLSTSSRSSSSSSCGSKKKLFVAASIGCYGAALADGSEYRGNYGLSKEQLYKFHEKKVATLLEQLPDFLAFETIPSKDECIAIMELLQTLHHRNNNYNSAERGTTPTLLPATWLSMACSDGACLNDGSKVMDVLEMIDGIDPDATRLNGIGINCCSFVHVIPLTQLIVQNMISSGIKRALIFYPNSGEEWDASNETWVKGTGCTSPTEFALLLSKAIDKVDETWSDAVSNKKVEEGHRINKIPIIVGGCCRTDPATISAIRDMVDRHHLG